jgi:hypothetical protein
MSNFACSTEDRPTLAKRSRFRVRWVRHAIPVLMAMFLVSVAGPAALAAPLTAAEAGTTGVAPDPAAPHLEVLSTPEAVAGLQLVPNVSLDSVSCFSKDHCVAVGTKGGFHRLPFTKGVVMGITNGLPGPVEVVQGTYGLDSVDCVSATTCYAVGTAHFVNPPEPNTTGGVEVTIVNGAVTQVADAGAPNFGPGGPGTENLYGIGCPSASACITVGYSNVFGGFAVESINGNPGAQQNFLPTGPFSANGVECVSGGTCMVNAETIGPRGDNGITGLDETVSIARHGDLKIDGEGGGGGDTLAGGSCHADDLEFCLIAGSAGAHGEPRQGGHGLVYVAVGVTSTRGVPVPDTSSLSDVSCASMYWCIATGQSASGEGVLVPIGWETPAAPVPVAGTTSFNAVSCASTGLCVAVGGGTADSSVVDSFRVWNGS